ncbi:protein SCAR3 isoform X2 [Cucumis sativus]|nr:protein SCAR3 isoform X2 [Cucumis sativus]
MDAYEECRDPPQLHLLDKFDTGGPGSCLKRYSDPTFFKRMSTSGKISLEKVRSDKKAHKIKRKRSSVRNGKTVHGASGSNANSSLQFTSFSNEGASRSQTATADRRIKSDAGDSSNSFDSGRGSGYAGSVLKLDSSLQTKEQEFRESSSSSLMQFSDAVDSVLADEQSRIIDDKYQCALEDQIDSSFSSHVTWDEKEEIFKPKQEVREKIAVVESRGQEDAREMAETLQLRTHLYVSEMAEFVHLRSQKDVREMEEIVQPRTKQNVREMAEMVKPRTQQDVRGMAEIVQSRSQKDAREMEEIVQSRPEQNVGEMAEFVHLRSQQGVREMEEIVQPRTKQSVREMAEIVKPRTRQDVRGMAEIVQSRSLKDVREMEEIVQSRTEQNVGEMPEIVQPRTQQDVREMAEAVPLREVEEIGQPRPEQYVRKITEIVQPRTQKDVGEMAEIMQPRAEQVFREMAEILPSRTQQDVRNMAEIVQPRTQQGGLEKPKMVEHGSQQGGRDQVEMVESRSQQHDKVKDQEYKVPLPESTQEPHETEGFYLINDEPMNMLANNGHPLESIYDGNMFDEIESETDNYMDALNTIESESETDLDCQTKREVEPCSSNIKCEVVDPTHDLLESSLGPDILILNPSNEPQESFDKGIVSSLPNLVSSDSFFHDQRLESTMKISSPDCPLVTDLHGKESSTMESDVSDSFPPDSNSSLEDQPGIKLLNRVHESETASFSSNLSDKFWTNGGLLGLQPSKPPSWAVPNAACEDSSKVEKRGPSDLAYVVSSNPQEIKLNNLPKDVINSEKDSTSNKSSLHHDDQKYDTSGRVSTSTPSQELSRGNSNAKNGSFSVDRSSDGSTYAYMNDVVKRNVIAAGIASPAVPNVNGMHTQTILEKDENSNQNSGLSHQLLVNGFHRKLTLIHDERFETTSMTTDGPGKRNANQDTVLQTMYERTSKEHLGCDSSMDSCPPSPPLDHMKISFHPVSGFEISKMKLRFPDGSEGRGSTKDIFPSFQLAPEESISVHEIGSESDDDTFCRSSPCMSDDCLSDHSKSNSDLWESDDTPETTGNNLYDLRHMSHVESLSTSFELEGITKNGIMMDDESGNLNGKVMDESLSGSLLDLPCFDIVNPVTSGRIDSFALEGDSSYCAFQTGHNDVDATNLLRPQCLDSPTPAPPPLPPAQWCVSKTSLDVSDDLKDLSAHPKQVEPIAFVQQITHASDATKPNGKKPEQVVVDSQKELNHRRNDQVMDSREDFLQQIREKSFNLRRTVTEKPSTPAGPAAHVKVTAILEKANAIRQAVGSDNGEDDDSWSDA